MNFYASRAYLDAAAAVYFKGREVAIENVRIGSDILRLLVVDGRIITRLQFLDFHQPLCEAEVQGPIREGRYAQFVVRGTIRCDEWQQDAFPGFELAPFIDWWQFPSFDAYKNQLLERHRGLVRDRERRWRSLAAAQGEPVFTFNDEADDVLAMAREWKSRQLVETGIPDYFADPKTMEFLQLLRERRLLVSSSLRAGGRLLSVWIGFIHEASWSGWVFTYDPAFRKYSVGHQLLNCMLEESYRLGHREFDFSDGGHDYKIMYATHGRLLGDIGRPPLKRAVVLLAKNTLRRTSPKLFEAIRSARGSLARPLHAAKAAQS